VQIHVPLDTTKTYAVTEHDLARANIGRRFWTVNRERIPDTCGYKQALNRWIDNMKGAAGKGLGLVLYGEFRAGKTAAAVIAMKAVLAHGGTAYIIRADSVAGAVVNQEKFDDEQTVEARCGDVDLLVIDDMTTAAGREQMAAMVERLVRFRYDHSRSLFVTVNSPKMIVDRFGAGIARVLKSRCIQVEVRDTPFFAEECAETEAFFKGNGSQPM
jgi:hypothetical protein